jgi:ABC-type multidrug transport system fused ATPase/permease subunit
VIRAVRKRKKRWRKLFLIRVWSTYIRLRWFGKPYRTHLRRGALASILVVACRLAFPWPIRGLIELDFHHGRQAAAVVALVPDIGSPLLWLGGSFVVIVLLQGVSEYIQRLAFARYAVGLTRDVRGDVLARLVTRDSALTERGPGALLAHLVGDSARLKSGVKNGLIAAGRNGSFFLGVFAIIAIVDQRIALVFLGGGLVSFALSLLGASSSYRRARRSRRKEDHLAGDLHRLFAGDEPSIKLDDSLGSGWAESKLTKVEGVTTIAVHAIYAASTCAILVLTFNGVRSGSLSPGAAFTIVAYVLLMHNRIVRLGRLIVRMGRVLASAERLARLAETPPGQAREPLRPGMTKTASQQIQWYVAAQRARRT